MRHYNLCTDDCNDIEKQINEMKPEELAEEQEFYDKVMARMLLKRAASHCWCSKFEESA